MKLIKRNPALCNIKLVFHKGNIICQILSTWWTHEKIKGAIKQIRMNKQWMSEWMKNEESLFKKTITTKEE
jgi:hypothetical protein